MKIFESVVLKMSVFLVDYIYPVIDNLKSKRVTKPVEYKEKTHESLYKRGKPNGRK